jgi:eukaryotic-like serine/threonine-protein kinase
VPANEPAIGAAAAAVLDGTPIDWPAAESGATEEGRQLLEELRLLWAVAQVHRQAPADDPEPGAADTRYWGRLRLIERIGGGTFGEVYRAWDPRLHREVALKLIPIPRGHGAGRSASIIREGRLLARVRHPGVVAIYDAEEREGCLGLCMEFVEGPTLEQRLDRHGAFTAAAAVEIGLQLCDALAAAHDAGVLHRDVKTANVVVKPDGRVVLMDFGAGRDLDDAFTTELTGTPLCLAPEVLQGHDATVRSDIYSVGVLLHHLLSGSYPVQARSLADLRQTHARRADVEPESVDRRHPEIPARLAAVIDRAIHPRPERRHHSAAALAADLRSVVAGHRAPARLLPLSAAILVAAVTGAVWLLTARGDDRAPVRLAVLPFAIDGDEPDSDLLRDGLTRDLVSRLQRFDNARVISTASAFSIAALDLPLEESAARLGVSNLVTGTAVRSGDTVGVEARLMSWPGERTLWVRQYSRPLSELLDLQRAMVLDIADALKLQSANGMQMWPTRSVEAYTLYVRGRTALDRFSRESTTLALQLFHQALALDPDYAQVYAAIAEVYLQVDPAIANLTGEESVHRATEAATRALSLDSLLPEAHVAAAGVKSARADWAGAERDYGRALELGPSNVMARQQYAHWLSLLGRFDDAIEQARIAESLDPRSPRAIMALASALRFAGRFEEAIHQANKALELDPGYLVAYLNLGHNYLGLGRLDEAIEFYRRHGQNGNLGDAYARAGRTEEARALIAHFERRYADTGLGAGHIAQIYCGLGEIDRAFEWLDRMDRFHAPWPTTFKVAQVWDPLRSDPRFAALLKKYGLAD